MSKLKKHKWNLEIRVFLYQWLCANFGPHEDWDTFEYPDATHKQEYNDWIKKWSLYCHKRFGIQLGKDENSDGVEAVKMQIAFATTTQPNIPQDRLRTYLSNKEAAYDAGFISKEVYESAYKQNVAEPNAVLA